MSRQTRTLPQAPPEVETAMALVCTLPESGRSDRRITLQSVIARARSAHELPEGVGFRFESSEEIANELLDLVLAERVCCANFSYTLYFEPGQGAIELRIEAPTDFARPLKDMYLSFATREGTHG
jgi:hypothetical protein